jgi:uncharacterized protein YbaR (Trm112 family)/SAM-dependent methyltransferase
MDAVELCCPRCHEPLGKVGEGAMACAGCGRVYPVIEGVPVLVPDPAAYLSHSLLALSDARSDILATLSELERIPHDPALAFRRGLAERSAAALRLDLALVDRLRAPLLARTGRLTRTAGSAHRLAERIMGRILRKAGRRVPPSSWTAPKTGYNFEPALTYLRTDWGGTAAGEEQIAAVNAAVAASVRQYCGPTPGRAAYLGAGLGRHAFDGGALFSSSLAVELSFAAAALLAAVRKGPIQFSTQNWHGASTEEEIVQVHRAVFPAPPYGANCQYVVADALRLPLRDASVDAVISIFFADVIPASSLFPEVRRVLRPGGRFINVGPLEYHFKGRAERLTKDELRHVIETVHGFRFEPDDRSFELPYMDSPGSVRTVFRVWSYVLTRA